MAFEIIRLKSNDSRATHDGMLVSATPSGKWDILGGADNSDGQSATFTVFAGIDDLDRAIRSAADWGGPRGFTKIYVKGDLTV